jgi:hypothetical protein
MPRPDVVFARPTPPLWRQRQRMNQRLAGRNAGSGIDRK